MPIVVQHDDLVSAFVWASRALPARPAQPVLAGMKVTTADGVLTVHAFDGDKSAVASVPCSPVIDPAEELNMVISGRLAVELAKALPGKDATFTVLPSGQVQLTAGRSTFTLPTLPVADYPTLPVSPDAFGAISSDDLAEAIGRVVDAAGKDETLPALTGVFITSDPENKTLTFATTDRYRLAVASVGFSPAAGVDPISILVPARALEGYVKTLAAGTQVELMGGVGHLFGVRGSDRLASTRVLDGEFPKYQALLPSEFAAVATVEKAEFAAAVKRVAMVADRNAPITLSFSADPAQVTVSAGTSTSSIGYASEVVDIDYTGEDIAINFNPGYLNEGLNSIPGEHACINLVSSLKAALVTSPDPTDDGKYLIMPVR